MGEVVDRKGGDINKAIIYDNVEVTDAEKEILTLPPEHAIFPGVNLNEMETDIEKCMIQCNWEDIKEGTEKEKKNREAEESSGVIFAAADYAGFIAHKSISWKLNTKVSKEVLSVTLTDDDGIDFAAHKAFQWKQNKRVIIP